MATNVAPERSLIRFVTAIYKDASPTGFETSVLIGVHPWLKIQTPIAPIVHSKMNTGKEFPSTFAGPRRDKSACIRFHVISARQVRFPSSPSLVRRATRPVAPAEFVGVEVTRLISTLD